MVSRRQLQEEGRQSSAAIKVVIVIAALAVGYVVGAYSNQIFSVVASAFGVKTYAGTLDVSTLQSTYQALKANFDGTLDDQKLIEGANKGMVEAAGDEYTTYMNAAEAKDFSDDLTGNIGGGVGIELGLRDDKLTVLRLLKDNPAEKAGVAVGDLLVSVNDESTDGKTVTETVTKIRGDIGTTVKLTVLRDNTTQEFTLTRAQVNNPSVYSSVVDGIGIMSVTRFDDQTGSLARATAQDFKNQNVKAVILDLRGNGGGYITAAQDLAGLWLDKQVVVSERTNGKVIDELRTGSNPLLAGIKTIVLVNGSSASASEIVAGALQDHKVATLLGEKTFGKGSVQKLLSLPEGAELKVTVAKWYTPNGANISKQGITPDTTVGIEAADLTAGRDPQLDAAKAALK